MRSLIYLILLALLSVPLGCGDSGGSGDNNGGGSSAGDDGMLEEPQEPLTQTASFISPDRLDTHLDVEWKPSLTKVDFDELDALIEYDWAAQRYTFDAAKAEQAGLVLEPGRPLLISGLTLRTIASVERSGGQIVVSTDSANLEDAIESGSLGWDYDMEFNEEAFNFSTMEFRQLTIKDGYATVGQPVKIDKSQMDVSLQKVADGHVKMTIKTGPYTYELEFKLNGSTFQPKFVLKKSTDSGVVVKYYMVGTVNAPSNKTNAVYEDGELKNFEYAVRNLTGEVEFGIIAAGSEEDDLTIPLPAPAFKYPILIGGVIPGYIEVGAAFAIKGKVPKVSQASIQLTNTVQFDSDIGIRWENDEVQRIANLGPLVLADGELDMASELDPFEIALALGYPRLKIGLLGNSATAEVQTTFSLGGELTFSPVCQKAKMSFGGQARYNLSVLGLIPISKGKEDLFNEYEEVLQDSCR